MKNFIKKHCWNCEYFDSYNKCALTNLSKSKKQYLQKMEIGQKFKIIVIFETNETNN